MTQPTLREATLIWSKIGLLSFGGPAGQIALMQEEVVNRRGWVPSDSFDRGLAFSMLLPGPEAQQLATWLGWRLHGMIGGLIAGAAFFLPGTLLMIGLAWLAAAQGDEPLVAAIFDGIQPFVIALVIAALWKIANRALKQPGHWALAIAAFIALAVFSVPFPLVVAAAGLAGYLMPAEHKTEATAPPRGLSHALKVAAAGLAVVIAVYGLNALAFGRDPFDEVAELFTTAALVTFGGAYAVLPFVAERAVETYGWLSPAEMLNGLAIAEGTPGPLILVNTYAGFFAGWQGTETLAAGSHAALLATFYTFAPSFTLILAFAPMVEKLSSIGWAQRALTGVSAAVVGVIANLAVFLAEAAFLPAGLADPEWPKLALFAAALVMVFRFGAGPILLVGTGIAAGIGLFLTGLA